MSAVVTPILQWLNENPHLAGVATFALSAAESIAIIGTIVPGLVTMTAVGALAGAGVIPLWSTLIWAILGAIAGDGVSYWLGYYFKDRLRRMWPFRDNPSILKSGETFVHKYGVISVFMGRFVGPVRALVPLVAGMLGMKPLQFTISNVASAIGWAPAYMLPGILLGAASMELPPDIALHFILVTFLVLLFFALCFYLLVRILQFAHIQIDQMQNSIWHFMEQSRVLAPLTILLRHHDKDRQHGQLNLAFYFLIFSGLFLALSYYVHITGAANISINDAFYHFFRGIRLPFTDNIMLGFTLLGQKQVVAPVIACVFGYLLYQKHFRLAAHTALMTVLAVGGAVAFKHILKSPRPWGIFNSPETYSMPSGHTIISIVLYLGLAFLLAHSPERKRGRWFIYAAALAVCTAVSVSRLYLGAHWFTDVFASWLLGSAVLCFTVISYERSTLENIPAKPVFLVALTSLVIAYSVFFATHFNKLTVDYAQIDWPVIGVDMDKWWSNENNIPERRTSLFGFPSQPINLEWAGSLTEIQATLERQGWKKPPARDFISTIHRLADISSSQYLPMISQQYQDKTPALIVTKTLPGIRNLVVLRLWDSSRYLTDNRLPIWVGTIGTVPRTYSWVTRRGHIALEVKPELIFTNKTRWTYKVTDLSYKNGKSQTRLQRVILVKPAR